jgi:hypothetical protein
MKKKEMDDKLPRNLWNLQYISCKLGVMSHTGAEHFSHDKACNPATQEQTFAICSYTIICMTSTIKLNTPHDTLMTQKLILQTIHKLHVYGRAKGNTALVCRCCRYIHNDVQMDKICCCKLSRSEFRHYKFCDLLSIPINLHTQFVGL